jgi:hypothetical protein
MPIQRRPILWATAAVVPLPKKLSRTRSPGLVARVRIRSIKRSGLGVAKTDSALNAFTSFFASWLSPTSSLSHKVKGTKPSCTSVKNLLKRGTLSPLAPNQILFSEINSSIRFSEKRQLVPAGGITSLPEGVIIGYISLGFGVFAWQGPEAQTPRGSLSGFVYPFSLSSERGKRLGRHISLRFA